MRLRAKTGILSEYGCWEEGEEFEPGDLAQARLCLANEWAEPVDDEAVALAESEDLHWYQTPIINVSFTVPPTDA